MATVPVAVIDSENEFDSRVLVATDTIQTGKSFSSQTTTVYANTVIWLPGNLVLAHAFHVIMDENDFVHGENNIKVLMKMSVQLDQWSKQIQGNELPIEKYQTFIVQYLNTLQLVFWTMTR